ncbi:LysR family transcriptional regulator, partial [Pseudomonas aeruginosa]
QAAIGGQGRVLASSILVSDSVASGLLQPYRADICVDGAGYSALCVPGREREAPGLAFFALLMQVARHSGHPFRLEGVGISI